MGCSKNSVTEGIKNQTRHTGPVLVELTSLEHKCTLEKLLQLCFQSSNDLFILMNLFHVKSK